MNRPILYNILQKQGIKGKLFDVIQSIYVSVKSCVRTSQGLSQSFSCPLGLCQGCKLSLILFVLFIDELHTFCTLLVENNIRGIQLFPDIVEIFLLMFADDIALLSDTVIGLQKQLNVLQTFCSNNKLSVNIEKTKILCFKRGGRPSRNERWSYANLPIEIVNGFTYVGVYFSSKLSMYKMAEAMSLKAKKALLCLFDSLQQFQCLPYRTFFKLFDSKVATILLYGSELWGLKTMPAVETVHMYACKRFLGSNKSACNDAVLGDLGRYPMYISSAKRCIKYWVRLLCMPNDRYPRLTYNMLMYYDSLGYCNWVTDCIPMALVMYGRHRQL